ncbi:hypothetical protein Leryth_023972, partial [Lithospermum erythrorhizon]
MFYVPVFVVPLELENKRKERAQVVYERKKQLNRLRLKAEKVAEEKLGSQLDVITPIKLEPGVASFVLAALHNLRISRFLVTKYDDLFFLLYWMHGSLWKDTLSFIEQVKIPYDKPFIYLRGQNKGKTMVVWDAHQGIDKSATFISEADNIL